MFTARYGLDIYIYNLLKPSGNYMYHQFNIHNSAFCPHSVFMCFVWISEQTASISLYSINWLVFITETDCVYCAVRTGSLNIAHGTAICSNPRIQILQEKKESCQIINRPTIKHVISLRNIRRSNFLWAQHFDRRCSFATQLCRSAGNLSLTNGVGYGEMLFHEV